VLRCSTFVGDPRRKAEGELLQAQLADAGIQLRIANANINVLFGEWLPKGNFDIADFAWFGSGFTLSSNQDTYRTGGSGNFGKFSDPMVDALFQQAIGELDSARAAAIGNQIDQRLWTQLPMIPLYQLQSFLAWREELVNIENNPAPEGPFWNAGSWGFARR
jgi:peptide/nickel transport system substrate-binding protein